MTITTDQQRELAQAMDAISNRDPQRAEQLIAWIKTGATQLYAAKLRADLASRWGESQIESLHFTSDLAEQSVEGAVAHGHYSITSLPIDTLPEPPLSSLPTPPIKL